MVAKNASAKAHNHFLVPIYLKRMVISRKVANRYLIFLKSRHKPIEKAMKNTYP
jgi:hypothetical protein